MSADDSRSEDLSAVRDGYDRWSAVYDHDANPLLALEAPRLRAAIGTVHDRALLDLGCGTGRHASWLASQGARVTAVDFSDGMLDVARQRCRGLRVDFRRHDLHEPLPLSDGAFDRVTSSLVLEHVRDLPGFFREMRRVLRPDGRAVVLTLPVPVRATRTECRSVWELLPLTSTAET